MRAVRAVSIALVLAACRSEPSDAELDRLHDEAVRANAELSAQLGNTEGPGYTLTVSGQIGTPPATLHWPELQRLATAHVETINIQNPDKQTPTNFRGVLVRDLLDRFAALPEATEATMVAIDGFRATVQLADARAYRMLLAVEADGEPIPQERGGPIFLVHPFSEAPELKWKYPDRFWAFYVTHVVVGTEAPRLAIEASGTSHVLDGAALAKLPAATLDAKVGWKVEWPADVVHLRGVRVVDAIRAAGVALPAGGRVVIRGKAPIHSDPERPIAFAIADLERCNPMLALRWGADEQPIPAKLGGPIALAPCGDETRAWVTFVEAIAVEPR